MAATGEGGALSSAGTTTIGSNCTADQLIEGLDTLGRVKSDERTTSASAPSTALCTLLEALNQLRLDNQAADLLLRQYVLKQKDALDSMLLHVTQLLKNQTAVIDLACDCLRQQEPAAELETRCVEGVPAQLSATALCSASCVGRPDLNATSLRMFRSALQRQQIRPRPLVGSPVLTNSPSIRPRAVLRVPRPGKEDQTAELSPLVRNLLASSWKKAFDRSFEPLDGAGTGVGPCHTETSEAAATLAAIVSQTPPEPARLPSSKEESGSYAERLVQSIFPSALLLNSVVDDLPSPAAPQTSDPLVHLVAPTSSAQIAGRVEPLVRQLLTLEMAKRPNLIGRDDYLFIEWFNSGEVPGRSFPYGGFRAEIIHNRAAEASEEGPPADSAGEDGGGSEDPRRSNPSICRFDPRCAQMLFETESVRIETPTRESCLAALTVVLDWAERRVTFHNLPSTQGAAANDSIPTPAENSGAGGIETLFNWNGNFKLLRTQPLPTDYGRSDAFDKRGSMRYIQLTANAPPIPESMTELRRKARNFSNWYGVAYGNGMWKAEVVVDQLNAKRNSFQRSLRQMSYQRAQVEVMRWLFRKCHDLRIRAFRYKGRRDEFLITFGRNGGVIGSSPSPTRSLPDNSRISSAEEGVGAFEPLRGPATTKRRNNDSEENTLKKHRRL